MKTRKVIWVEPELIKRNVIAVLVKTMKKNRVSQNELHRRTGIPQGLISRLLAGNEFDITLVRLIQICNGLQCHPNDFIRYPVRRRHAFRQ